MLAWILKYGFGFLNRMAHRYRIDPSFGLVIDKFEGKMDWHDLWEGMLRSSTDPEFRLGMNVVADLTTARLDLAYQDARTLALEVSGTPTMKYGRVAVVAPKALQFGIARMFGVPLADRELLGEYRVFSDYSEARSWLGLPEDLELGL
jgi:hypothetical protein